MSHRLLAAASRRRSSVSPPDAPVNLLASAGNGEVNLSWDASAGAITYTVYRSTTSGSGYSSVQSGIGTNSFSDTTVTNDTTYYYVVTATNANGESGNSNESSATPSTDATAPVLSGITAVAAYSTATVTWTTDELSTSVVHYDTVKPDVFTQADAGSGSTDFPGTALEAGWSTADTVGDCTFTVADDRLTIDIPGGVSHDPGTANNTAGLGAPRIERVQADTDFDIFVKIDSDAFTSGNLSGHGFIVRSATSTTRQDVYANGTSGQAYVKAGSTVVTPAATPAGKGIPAHLRLTRVGTDYTFQFSFDGSTWTTCATYSWADAVTHIGVYAFNAGGTPAAHTCKFDYIHTSDTPPVAVAEGSLTKTRKFDDDFSVFDAARWSDDSANGGTATVGSGVLTLACTTTDESTGRVVTLDSYSDDVGVLFRVRDPSAAPTGLFLAIGLRAQGAWANQYAADKVMALEISPANTFVRIVRNGGTSTNNTDNGLFSYMYEQNDAAVSLDSAWTWFRFEAAGPFLRYRAWDDGASEPSSWTTEFIDETVNGGGKVGFAISHNNGTAVAGSLELDDVQVYEISGNYANTVSDASMVTSHVVDLSSLTSSTTYHYRVESVDGTSNKALSEDNTFTTTAAATTWISPNSGSVANSNNITVRVYVDSGSEQHETVQARLTFDPAKFSYVSNDATESDYDTSGVNDQGSGYIEIVRGNTAPLTGKQVFVDVTFQALVDTGTGDINFDDDNTHIIFSGSGLTDTSIGGTYTFTA